MSETSRAPNAQRRADRVHGRVAGADDADARADGHWPALADAAQEAQRIDDALGILALETEPPGALGTHGHEDGAEALGPQVVQRDVDDRPSARSGPDAETLEDGEVLRRWRACGSR